MSAPPIKFDLQIKYGTEYGPEEAEAGSLHADVSDSPCAFSFMARLSHLFGSVNAAAVEATTGWRGSRCATTLAMVRALPEPVTVRRARCFGLGPARSPSGQLRNSLRLVTAGRKGRFEMLSPLSAADEARSP